MGFSLRFYYPQLFPILDSQPSAPRQAHGGEQALCGVESFSFPRLLPPSAPWPEESTRSRGKV